jgi:ribosomal protein L14
MIGLKGTLNVIDNSGAIIAECIRVMSGARFARAGNFHLFLFDFKAIV